MANVTDDDLCFLVEDKDFLLAQCKQAPIECFCVSELWREEVKHFIASISLPKIILLLMLMTLEDPQLSLP